MVFAGAKCDGEICVGEGGFMRKRVICLLLISFFIGRIYGEEDGLNLEFIVQTGHSSSIISVVYSPDGKIIASGSEDDTIKLWESRSGKLIKTLTGHSFFINSVAFSSDGNTIASGSGDATIKLWDTKSGKLIQTLTGHSSNITSAVFSPDGNTMASGSQDKTVKLWDTKNGKLIQTLIGHSSYVNSVAFSPDGKIISSGSLDATIKLWDTKSGKLLQTLTGHSSSITSVVFSPDGNTIASGSFDDTIKIWDSNSGRLIRTRTGYSDAVSSVVFSPDGKSIVSCNGNNTIKIWDSNSMKLLRTITGHSSFVNSATFSPDGSTIASGSTDKTIKIWDSKSGKLINTLTGHSSSVLSVTYSPDGNTMASGNMDKTIKIWDSKNGKLINTLTGHSSLVNSTAFSPDGNTIVSGSTDKTIKIWDSKSGKLINTLTGHVNGIRTVSFSPDGNIIASGSWDNAIKLWDYKSGKLIKTLTGHSKGVSFISFSPDGNTIASGSGDKTIKIWDSKNGKLIKTLKGHLRAVTSISFSPDKDYIASGSEDKTIKIWDRKSGKNIRTLMGHSAAIEAISFSPDGNYIASSSGDNTIKIWYSKNGKLIHTLSGHSNSVYSLAFSKDGNTIVSGSGDTTIRIWDVKNAKQLIAIYPIDQNDFIVFNPQYGYYTASPKGEELASWRVDDRLFSVEQYSHIFNHPDLIEDILAEKEVPPPNLNPFKNRPPDFIYNEKYLIEGNQIILFFDFKGDAPLGDVTNILNGNPFDVKIQQEQQVQEVKINITPQIGDNILKIRATDQKWLKSRWYTIDFHFTGKEIILYTTAKGGDITEYNKRKRKAPLGNYGKKYAVIIGISDYKELPPANTNTREMKDLRFAHNDAIQFKEFLTQSKKSGDDWNIILLTNKEATIPRIDKELSSTLLNAGPDDLIFIFFSGHGRSHNIQKNRVYLLTHDFTPDNYRSGYNYSDLFDMVQQSRAEHIVVFIDACKSGAIYGNTKGEEAPPDFKGALEDKINQLSTNKLFITSSTGQQISYEYPAKQMGYFTYYLLQGLNGKAQEGKTNKNFIDLSELYQYIDTNVLNATKEKEKIPQKPDLIFVEGGIYDDFPVAIRE